MTKTSNDWSIVLMYKTSGASAGVGWCRLECLLSQLLRNLPRR